MKNTFSDVLWHNVSNARILCWSWCFQSRQIWPNKWKVSLLWNIFVQTILLTEGT